MLMLLLVTSWFNPTPHIQSNQSLKIEAGETQSGTAVLIDSWLVLTAAHVLALKNRLAFDKEIKVYCYGVQYSAKIIKIDQRADLALLRLSNECTTVPLSRIAQIDPDFGASVYTVGCPSEYCGLASHGIVSGFQEDTPEHGRWMFSDTQIFLGSSGGGLFLENGDLVGICSRIRNFTKVIKKKNKKEDPDVITQMYSIWIPVNEIRNFLGI